MIIGAWGEGHDPPRSLPLMRRAALLGEDAHRALDAR